MQRLEHRELKIDELRIWKERIDDIASPVQIKALVDKVQSHETFKTRAITVFAVVQFLMAAAIAIQKLL